MKITRLGIEGAWLAESEVWPDERGFFREWFQQEDVFRETGLNFSVQQANFSLSGKGVVRGIHYSLAPLGQAKWVTCVSGSILDVVVDLRPNSKTFKKIEYIELNPKDGKAVLIGSGLGHGFISKEDNSGVSYLLTSPYSPGYELDISPLDEELGIQWSGESIAQTKLVLSPKDLSAPTLKTRLEQVQLPS